MIRMYPLKWKVAITYRDIRKDKAINGVARNNNSRNRAESKKLTNIFFIEASFMDVKTSKPRNEITSVSCRGPEDQKRTDGNRNIGKMST